MPTKMRMPSEQEQMEYEQYQRDVIAEVQAEVHANDPVRQMVRFHAFVSKSKGRGRKRKHWEEIRLVSYCNGPFMMWHKFPFDVYATECLGEEVSWDNATQTFMDRIEDMERRP